MSSREEYGVPATMEDLLGHQGLVGWVIHQHFRWALVRGRMDIQDLKQEGFLGLVRAMQKYDAARDAQFATYAYWWIRSTIGRYVSQNVSALSVPQGAMLGRHYGKTEETRALLRVARRVVSLNDPRGRREGSARRSLDLADPSRPHWDCVDGSDEASVLMAWCRGHLTDLQFRVLYGRFADDKTLDEVSHGMGLDGQDLTRERVRQIEEKAKDKIHRYYPGREPCPA